MSKPDRQATYRQRQAAKGLTQFAAWVPASAVEQMRKIAESIRRGEPIRPSVADAHLKNSPSRG